MPLNGKGLRRAAPKAAAAQPGRNPPELFPCARGPGAARARGPGRGRRSSPRPALQPQVALSEEGRRDGPSPGGSGEKSLEAKYTHPLFLGFFDFLLLICFRISGHGSSCRARKLQRAWVWAPLQHPRPGLAGRGAAPRHGRVPEKKGGDLGGRWLPKPRPGPGRAGQGCCPLSGFTFALGT